MSSSSKIRARASTYTVDHKHFTQLTRKDETEAHESWVGDERHVLTLPSDSDYECVDRNVQRCRQQCASIANLPAAAPMSAAAAATEARRGHSNLFYLILSTINNHIARRGPLRAMLQHTSDSRSWQSGSWTFHMHSDAPQRRWMQNNLNL